MPDSGRGALGGGAIILACGVLLGLAYNWFGLMAAEPWGLGWIAEDRIAAFAEAQLVTADEPVGDDDYWTDIDDPLAVPAAAAFEIALPEIPDAGRPVQIE